MLAQRLSEAADILAKLGGECAAEYKYDGIRVQAHRTADGRIELFTRGLERIGNQFPDVVEPRSTPGSVRPRRSSRARSVAYDAAAGELRPFQEVMFRRRKHGIAEAVQDVPVGLFCFDLLYADGEDLTRLPYPERRARLAAAITLSDRLRLTTAVEVDSPAALDAAFEQAITDGCEGLVCKSVGPGLRLPGRRPRLAVDQAQAGLPDRAVRHGRPRRGRRLRTGAAAGAASTARCCWPRTTRTPDVFRTVGKCGTGFSDAELAALPERLAPLVRPDRPAGSTRGTQADVWFDARAGAGGAQRRADPLPEPHRRLGPARAGRRAGDALPPLHRPLARRQGPARTPPPRDELVDLFRTARPTPAAPPE